MKLSIRVFNRRRDSQITMKKKTKFLRFLCCTTLLHEIKEELYLTAMKLTSVLINDQKSNVAFT